MIIGPMGPVNPAIGSGDAVTASDVAAQRGTFSSNIEAVIASVNRLVVASNIQAVAASFSGVVTFGYLKINAATVASIGFASGNINVSFNATATEIVFQWKNSAGTFYQTTLVGTAV